MEPLHPTALFRGLTSEQLQEKGITKSQLGDHANALEDIDKAYGGAVSEAASIGDRV